MSKTELCLRCYCYCYFKKHQKKKKKLRDDLFWRLSFWQKCSFSNQGGQVSGLMFETVGMEGEVHFLSDIGSCQHYDGRLLLLQGKTNCCDIVFISFLFSTSVL